MEMKTRYYVNVRTPEGENPAFVEVTEATYAELAKGERRAMKFDYKQYFIAMYHGRGEFEQDGELHQYLQYLAVDLITLNRTVEPAELERIDDMAVHVVARVDPRPGACRFRLAEEGKPYPKSSCQACGRNIATGLGRSCHKTA